MQTRDSVAFAPGSSGVVVDLACVVDPSLGYETTFDSSKVDWVATAPLDCADAEVSNTAQSDREARPKPQALPGPYTPTPPEPGAPPPPIERLAEEGREVSAEQFEHALDNAIATLANLSGTPRDDIPRPQEVKARKHSPSRVQGGAPSYSFKGNELRYGTADLIRGTVWESTTDPAEALYWMVNDVARSRRGS